MQRGTPKVSGSAWVRAGRRSAVALLLITLAACGDEQGEGTGSTLTRGAPGDIPNVPQATPTLPVAPTPLIATRAPTQMVTPHAVLSLGSVSGSPAGDVRIEVTLDTAGLLIAGAQNDLVLGDRHTSIAAVRMCANAPDRFCSADTDCADDDQCLARPDCTRNSTINKELTVFAFQPPGCDPDTDCTGIRALVLSLEAPNDPIPDGAALYSCRVRIAADAPDGDDPMESTNVVLASPHGGRVWSATGNSAVISVQTGGPTMGSPEIIVGDARGAPATQVTVDATLRLNGSTVVGTQNDITFDTAHTPIAAAGFCADTPGQACSVGVECPACVTDADCPAGRTCTLGPACAANPAIKKEAGRFAFQPPGCTPGVDCTGVRALVFSAISPNRPIADGAILYTCTVDIAADAPAGAYPLNISGLVMSAPQGDRVEGTGCPGTIVVTGEGPTPTPTPASPLSPSPTPTPVTPPQPFLDLLHVGSVFGAPGDRLTFDVSLNTMGLQIAGVQNDLTFDSAHTPIGSAGACDTTTDEPCSSDADCPAGEACQLAPDCSVNQAIRKEATRFAFLPPGCTAIATCTGVRAIVFSLASPRRPVPDGSVLYTCTIAIAPDALGDYPLEIDNVLVSNPDGRPIPGVSGTDGKVVVEGGP